MRNEHRDAMILWDAPVSWKVTFGVYFPSIIRQYRSPDAMEQMLVSLRDIGEI
jgi:hypothetical protein